jgi:hypothetical protein
VAPVLSKTRDNEEIIERVAALDIGKAELVCCVRVPDEDHLGRRLQEVESYSTMARPLLGMADRLACLGVTRVVMEATSDYWKPVFYLLEAAGFETWLVNAKEVRAVSPAGQGGNLSSSRLLLRQSALVRLATGYIDGAVISPDGSSVAVVEMNIPGGSTDNVVSVVQVSATTGKQLSVRYQVDTGNGFSYQFSAPTPLAGTCSSMSVPPAEWSTAGSMMDDWSS